MNDLQDVVIRPFAKGDRPLVEAFFGQMGGETRALFDAGGCNSRAVMRYFEGNDENAVRFLAECGGRMVGYVFLWDMHKGVPWLGIAVAEDWKGKHLGRMLLEHAHGYAGSRGKGGILLTTSVANVRGQGLYSRMGYERLGMHAGGEHLYLLRFDT